MSAFEAEFIGYRTYEKKPYVRLIFEIPVEREGAIRDILGNTPLPGTSVWAGIARITPQIPENREPDQIGE